MKFFPALAFLELLHYTRPTKAAPASLGTSLSPSLLSPSLTNEPRIFCQRDLPGFHLQKEQIRECKSAVAFLPLPYSEAHTFGPHETLHPYRTPISSTHSTRCEARVTMVDGFSSDQASWEDVREGAWDVLATCLDAKSRLGFARVGERYGIKVEIKYHRADIV